jgi:WD40 repeat protein
VQVLQGLKKPVHALAFAPDGRHLAAGGTASRLEVWALPAGTAVRLASAKPPLYGVAFTPDGNRLFVWSPRNEVVCHAAPDWAPVARRRGRSAGLSPNGSVLVTAHDDALVAWSLAADSRQLWHCPVDPQSALGVGRPVFAPDGERLAVVLSPRCVPFVPEPNHGRLEVRAAPTGAVQSQFDLPPGSYHLAAWSPDGRAVVTVGTRLRVWEALGGRLVAEHRVGPRRWFTGAAFHPTAPVLLASADDGGVRLYRTDTWQEAERYDWGLTKVHSLAVAPDGMRAAAGGHDGRIVVWDLGP